MFQLAVDDVEVGPTDGAAVHLQQELAGRRFWLVDLLSCQQRFRPMKDHRSHESF
jgi:hypothetical protein